MKQPFNVSGVAQEQYRLMELSNQELTTEMQQLCEDPFAWLLSHFEFSTSQQQQLQTLDPNFVHTLADELAHSWLQRELVAFQKDEPSMAKAEKSHNKDVIFFRNTASQQRISEESRPINSSALSVQIKYS